MDERLYADLQSVMAQRVETLVNQRGRGFASDKESWADLRKRVEECDDLLKNIKTVQKDMWKAIRDSDPDAYGALVAEEAQTGAAQACPCMTVARLHDILTAAMACGQGNAVITVKGQRFSTMALRISFSIGAEAESVAELVAEVEA